MLEAQFDIPKTIQNIRNDLSLSQREFAKLIGISEDKLRNYEIGRSKVPADVFLKILAVDINKSRKKKWSGRKRKDD